MDLRDTLKPKMPSYSFMSLLRRVLLPAPDGPLSTTGLGPAIAVGPEDKKEVRTGHTALLHTGLGQGVVT